jgi:HEAT repeat protein
LKARIGIIVTELGRIPRIVSAFAETNAPTSPESDPFTMILSRVWLLAFGMLFSVVGCAEADGEKPTTVVKIEKPKITSLDDALTHAADRQSSVRLEAIIALGDMWSDEQPVRPEVIKLLMRLVAPSNAELVQAAAEISIQKIGAAAMPAIKIALASKDRAQLAAACRAIKSVGPDAIELLPQLIQLLESDEPFNQRAALYALQGIGDQAFEAIEPVAGCLASDDFNVHCMACRFLEKFGPDALPAEDGLIQILQNGNPSSRGWAAIVLGAIGPTDKNDIVPMLIARLVEARAHVEKQRILLGLAHLGREAQRAIPTVKEYLNSRSHRVQPHAAYALYKIGDEKQVMDKVLLEALSDINERDAAFELIKRLEPEEAIALQSGLVKLLSAPEEDVREKAVLAIGRLGPAAKDTLPEVQKLLDDPDALVQEAAAQTIASLNYEPKTEEAGEVQDESAK